MTENQQKKYAHVNELKHFVNQLKSRKFKLDCGHHVCPSGKPAWNKFLKLLPSIG